MFNVKSANKSARIQSMLWVALLGFSFIIPAGIAAKRRPPAVSKPAETAVKSTTTLSGNPLPFSLGAADGLGDYHLHQLSNLGYDGRLLHGHHEGSESQALGSCTGVNHAVSWIPGALTSLFHQAEVGMHHFKKHGYHSDSKKRYLHWPLWKTVTHQQAWEGWLKQAHDNGLNLIVMSAVNFRYICGIMPRKNGFYDTSGGVKPCEDMKNIRRQLQAARDFDRKHSWYEIALSPGHARRIISEGKMAAILAIETSEIFGNVSNTAQLERELKYYYDMGVRSIQVVHELDNQFGGTAFFQGLFDIVQTFVNVKSYAAAVLGGDKKNIDELWTAFKGIRTDSNKHNIKGLSALGKTFVNKMMDRKMIVDLAHLSERSFNDVYNISASRKYYPLLLSHGHYRDMFTGKLVDEKKVSYSGIQKIKRTGGVFGLRTGNEVQRTYTKGRVANNCHGSTRSFAQSYTLGAIGYGIDQGFASDMNGFIDQIRPRFYDGGSKWKDTLTYKPSKWACGSGKAGGAERDIARAKQGSRWTYGTRSNYDVIGFAHIGMIRDVIKDLNKLGVNTVGLENSAESFLAMWDRAYNPNRGRLNDRIDRSGIVTEHSDSKCPALRTKLGSLSAKPVCKALPHFKIKSRKCKSTRWNGYCLWNKGSWWKARQIK